MFMTGDPFMFMTCDPTGDPFMFKTGDPVMFMTCDLFMFMTGDPHIGMLVFCSLTCSSNFSNL